MQNMHKSESERESQIIIDEVLKNLGKPLALIIDNTMPRLQIADAKQRDTDTHNKMASCHR